MLIMPMYLSHHLILGTILWHGFHSWPHLIYAEVDKKLLGTGCPAQELKSEMGYLIPKPHYQDSEVLLSM